VALGEVADRVRGLGERVDPVDHRRDRPGLDQLRQVVDFRGAFARDQPAHALTGEHRHAGSPQLPGIAAEQPTGVVATAGLDPAIRS
jgi:hypothetical protein